MERLFPDIGSLHKRLTFDPDDNNVVYRNCIINGKQSSGKTTMVKSIVEFLVEKYGTENVNAVSSSYDFNKLISFMDDRPVQVLILEDLTNKPISKKELSKFFEVRHEYYRVLKEKGYDIPDRSIVVTIITCHQFFRIPKELRTDIDLLIIKNKPTNMYDTSYMRIYFGDAINSIVKYTEQWLTDPKYKSYCLYRTDFSSGLFFHPLHRKNYILNTDEVCLVEEEEEQVVYSTAMENLTTILFASFISIIIGGFLLLNPLLIPVAITIFIFWGANNAGEKKEEI